MTNVSRRGWTTVAVLMALGIASLSLWAWSSVSAETDPEGDDSAQNAADDPVPDRDGAKSEKPADENAPNDGETTKKPLALPQPGPKPKDDTVSEREELAKLLEIEVEKPFRRVRGSKTRFDVTVRVKNVTDEPVEGPVFLTMTGSTFENAVLLKAPAVSETGQPLFEVIEKDRALSNRARRGRVVRMSFELEEEPNDESLAAGEIDLALTRKGLALAEPIARSKTPHGRGRGLKNRALPISADDPDMQHAQEAVAEVSGDLIRMDGVHAVGTAVNEEHDIVQLVMIGRLGIAKNLPKEIGGVPVETKVTWPIKPRYDLDDPNNRGQAGTSIVTLPPPGACPNLPDCQTGGLQSRFDPEIPIGAQIGNVTDTPFIGTYGSLVQRNNVSFILSNSHVLADSNLGVPGERIAQPNVGAANEFASLSAFVTIDFSAGAQNRVDGAIAQIDPSGRIPTFITPCYGYGAQSNLPVAAQVGDVVSKCGRTTDCTVGTVTSINMLTNVDYAPQPIATFVNQIVIVGNTPAPFSQGGDSGSAIVNTAGGANRVTGLLFAGGLSGGVDFTFANQIDDVLAALSIEIIGIPPGCPTR